MKRRTLLIVLVVGALAAGGAAFTNTISGTGTTNNTAGYAAVNVQGATLNDAVYDFASAGSQVTGVTLTFAGDQTPNVVDAGLDVPGTSATPPLCNGSGVTSGSGLTLVTTYHCTWSAVSTATSLNLDILVSNP